MPDEDPFFWIHRGLLQIVIENILYNSFIATRNVDEPKLAVIGRSSVRNKDEKWISVTFADNGPGVSDAVRQFLMPGVRLKNVNASFGLGLPIVRDIVTSYGGDFCVCKSENNAGAKFLLELPDRQRQRR